MDTTSTVAGTVRSWDDEQGWGVLDAPETPGGCWAHFSVVMMPGYRSLDAGEQVEFAYETPGQDGFDYRAVAVYPAGGDGGADLAQETFLSTGDSMTITFGAAPEGLSQLVVPLMVTYDAEADAAYLRELTPIEAGGVARTVSVDLDADGGTVNLDLDDRGRLIGLEVLDAARLLGTALTGGSAPEDEDGDAPEPE